MYYVPQELRTETKIHKGITWNDIVLMSVSIAVISILKGLVYEPLLPVYFIFNIIMTLFLITRSPFNPQKRMYFSIYCFLKKDRAAYISDRTTIENTIDNLYNDEEEINE